MDDFTQPQTQEKPKGSMGIDANDKKIGAIIYFLGLIIISVIAVGYLVFKSIGLL